MIIIAIIGLVMFCLTLFRCHYCYKIHSKYIKKVNRYSHGLFLKNKKSNFENNRSNNEFFSIYINKCFDTFMPYERSIFSIWKWKEEDFIIDKDHYDIVIKGEKKYGKYCDEEERNQK